jgi:2-haloacid dehalogenase
MAQRPLVIAFDVIETLFPLEPLRTRITEAGQPGHLLELWFARLLRDAFALTAAGGYRPFPEVAAGALTAVTGNALGDREVQQIVAGFGELDPRPDAEPAVRAARDAGLRVVTLTNGSARNTGALLERAGLRQQVERVISVHEVRRWKPVPEPYRHAAAVCEVPADRVALIAAHGWDVHGARHAGLTTGWVSHLEGHFPAVFDPADVNGDDLVTVVDGLLQLQEA